MSEKGIRRYISWYEKEGDNFIADEDMNNIELKDLQQLFNVPKDNPMYDCWPIKEQHILILQKHINHNINLQKHDYFVEATSI